MEADLEVPWNFTDLPLSPVLIKDGLGVQLGLSHAHSDPEEEAKNVVAPNRLPRASHEQHLTLIYNTITVKRP